MNADCKLRAATLEITANICNALVELRLFQQASIIYSYHSLVYTQPSSITNATF
jgi:hypothetical protein